LIRVYFAHLIGGTDVVLPLKTRRAQDGFIIGTGAGP
jgi:hypothetical protein